MKIAYEEWNPNPVAQTDIARAEQIFRQYAAQGYDLTLRQLYYQFVARGWIPNNMRSYKRLGDIINRARLSGRLDWDYIVDRTRNLVGNSHWDDPSSIISSAASSFALDKWLGQPVRVEVWVEKEALAGVIGRVAEQRDVDWFACRGYVSQSEMWGAAQRLAGYLDAGQEVVILHLGDHDPSGLDMSRDIADRLAMFLAPTHDADRVEVRRIALNRDQIDQYRPPPNPAKLTDSRGSAYVREHGNESWELDALDPNVLSALIDEHIDSVIDPDLFGEQQTDEDQHRALLTATSDRWDEVVQLMGGDR